MQNKINFKPFNHHQLSCDFGTIVFFTGATKPKQNDTFLKQNLYHLIMHSYKELKFGFANVLRKVIKQNIQIFLLWLNVDNFYASFKEIQERTAQNLWYDR